MKQNQNNAQTCQCNTELCQNNAGLCQHNTQHTADTANSRCDATKQIVTTADANAEVATAGAEIVAPAKTKRNMWDAHSMAVMGILTAVSYLLYLFVKFPLPFIFPAFLDIQISEMPALLGGFALGPVQGAIIVIAKCLLKLPFTSTACVGELGDIIIGVSFVVPASIIYHMHKSKKHAIIGLIVGSVCAVVASLVSNMWLLIPFYANAYGMEDIIGMVASLYDGVTTETFMSYYLPLAVVPFNLLRTILCAVVAYFTYKPLSKALHWEYKKAK